MIQLKDSGVVFVKEGHTYTLDGKPLQGITSTLVNRAFPHKLDGIPEEKLKAAAERGTAIHEKIAAYMTDEDFDVCPELMSWVKLIEDKNMEHIAAEYLVTDRERYASAIDHVLQDAEGGIILVDVKTNWEPPYESAALQLSIYRRFFEAQNPGLKVKSCVMVWLRGEKYEWKELPSWADECLDDLFRADAEDKPFDITTTYGDLPARVADVELYLCELDRDIKQMTAKMDEIKAGLCNMMLKQGIKKFTTPRLSLCAVAPKPKKTFDTKAFQKDNPEEYERYTKTTEVKPSVRLTIK